MNIFLLEPYFTGSHADWALGFQRHSRHAVRIFQMKGQFWKWRMHGGAITLAREVRAAEEKPDVILATDMLDVGTFAGLIRRALPQTPIAVYFHENQFAYPWSEQDRDVGQKRDRHYGFINFVSALAADAVYFNSEYNRDSFFEALPKFLRHFPDYRELEAIKAIEDKSSVLHLGLDLQRFDAHQTSRQNSAPLMLWNHRWEHDKNPKDFFKLIEKLDAEGFDFELAVVGENFRQQPAEFEQAKAQFADRLVKFGFADSFKEYAAWLWRADVLPVTSLHDFFGAGVAEAIYCGCTPVLPNRLAYPGIIPPEFQDQILYQSFEELYEKTAAALSGGIRLPGLKAAISQFDWRHMVGTYDDEMDRLVERG